MDELHLDAREIFYLRFLSFRLRALSFDSRSCHRISSTFQTWCGRNGDEVTLIRRCIERHHKHSFNASWLTVVGCDSTVPLDVGVDSKVWAGWAKLLVRGSR